MNIASDCCKLLFQSKGRKDDDTDVGHLVEHETDAVDEMVTDVGKMQQKDVCTMTYLSSLMIGRRIIDLSNQ